MFSPYLMILGSPKVRFGGLFFSFCSVSSFPILLSSLPSWLLFLPCFCFSLLHLIHFSLNSQGRWHAGQLGLVFLLEKEWLCCSNDCCCWFQKKVQTLSSFMFSAISLALQLSFHSKPKGIGMQLVGFSFFFMKEGLFPIELQLGLRERKGHLTSLPCIYTLS